MRKKVLLDCDGVLADFTGSVLNLFNKKLGKKFKFEDVVQFDIFGCLGVGKMGEELLAYAIEHENFVKNILPIPFSQRIVGRLHDNFDVQIITSPYNSPTWIPDREWWLNEHFGLMGDKVKFIKNKSEEEGDFFVDDKLENVVNWAENHPAKCAMLFDAPYNQTNQNVPITRVYDWLEIDEIIQKS